MQCHSFWRVSKWSEILEKFKEKKIIWNFFGNSLPITKLSNLFDDYLIYLMQIAIVLLLLWWLLKQNNVIWKLDMPIFIIAYLCVSKLLESNRDSY